MKLSTVRGTGGTLTEKGYVLFTYTSLSGNELTLAMMKFVRQTRNKTNREKNENGRTEKISDLISQIPSLKEKVYR